MPLLMLSRFVAALVGLAILAAAAWLLYDWSQGELVRDAVGRLHTARQPDWRLWTGLGLAGWSVLGRFIVLLFFPKRPDEPDVKRAEGTRIEGADGASLWVERYGPEGAPTLVFTHGWGLDSSAWNVLKAKLSDRYRLVMWDLPGLGRSKGPSGGRYTLEGFAGDLRRVVEQSGGAGRVVLVGHSIGGMTTQTLLRDAPDFVRERVAGAVLVDTTYHNPLDTLVLSGLWKALRFPLIEPLCWLQIALSPIVHLMTWKSWLDGTAHLAARLGFGSRAPRKALDHVARLSAYNPPGVQAKGNLAMFRWSVESALPKVRTPVLVVGGTKDIVTLPRASRFIAGAVPGAELTLVEGGGHMGFMEQPERYAEAIDGFARRVLADRTGGQGGRAAA